MAALCAVLAAVFANHGRGCNWVSAKVAWPNLSLWVQAWLRAECVGLFTRRNRARLSHRARRWL